MAEHVPEILYIREFRPLIRAKPVGQEGQGTGGHLPGVQLLEGAGGGVARVGEGGETFRVPFLSLIHIWIIFPVVLKWSGY